MSAINELTVRRVEAAVHHVRVGRAVGLVGQSGQAVGAVKRAVGRHAELILTGERNTKQQHRY